VVVDVSNSPSFEDVAALEFCETSTSNLLDAEAAAGVGHHVALSVVEGAELIERTLLAGDDTSLRRDPIRRLAQPLDGSAASNSERERNLK
jgi:hypothetical protein